MPFENGIQQRPNLHGAAAHIQTFDLKGHDLVVASQIEIVQFNCYICHIITPWRSRCAATVQKSGFLNVLFPLVAQRFGKRNRLREKSCKS